MTVGLLGLCFLAAPSVPVHPPLSLGEGVYPSAALTDSGAVVAWVETTALTSEVFVARSADLQNFDAPRSLSGLVGTTETIRPDMARRGDQVVVVWADASRGDHDVYAVVSEDAGMTFSPPALVHGGPASQTDPRVTILDDGTIAVAFHDSFGSSDRDRGVVWTVRVATSVDARGSAWLQPVRIDGGETFALFADASGDGTSTNPLIVTYTYGEPAELRVVRSTDGGASFSPPETLSSAFGAPIRPRAASSDAANFVAFDVLAAADLQADPSLVLQESSYLDVALTTLTGTSAATASDLINQERTLNQSKVALDAAGSLVALAWVSHQSPGVRKIVTRTSTNGGAVFGPEVTVSDNADADEVQHPAVATDGSRVLVVWEESMGGRFHVRAATID